MSSRRSWGHCGSVAATAAAKHVTNVSTGTIKADPLRCFRCGYTPCSSPAGLCRARVPPPPPRSTIPYITTGQCTAREWTDSLISGTTATEYHTSRSECVDRYRGATSQREAHQCAHHRPLRRVRRSLCIVSAGQHTANW
eukprot:197673-Rhodomonas_salina.1